MRQYLATAVGAAAVLVGLLASVYQLVVGVYSGDVSGLVTASIIVLVFVGAVCLVWARRNGWPLLVPVATWGVVTASAGTLIACVVLVVLFPPTARADPAATIATVPLGTGPPDRPTLYFGTLESMVYELNGEAEFPVDRPVLQGDPKRCVLTVVVDGVSQPPSTVVVRGLPATWAPVEPPVTNRPLGRNSAIRQRLVAPSADIKARDSWTATATLVKSDETVVAVSNPFTITVESRGVDDATWTVDGTPVACRLS